MNIQSLNLIVDINNDGRYDAWELWEAVKFLYRLPGNMLVETAGNIPYLASLLHIQASAANGYASLDGLLSVTLSLIFWVFVVFGILTLASPRSDSDDDLDISPEATHPAHIVQSTPRRRHYHASRSVYAAPGRKPKRHPWHHLVPSWLRQVKP